MSLFQEVVNFFYRYPKSRLKTYNRFGGYFAYKRLEYAHKKMMLASLSLKPVKSYNDGLPVYFLTGKKYIHQTLFCIQSLTRHSTEHFCFHLIDDGSFDELLIDRLKQQLPEAIIIRQQEIERYINHSLPTEKFPILRRKRKEYPHIKKLTDAHIFPAGSTYKLVLDSDMLFFHNPEAMINWLKMPNQPIHMVDCGEAYGYPHQVLEELAEAKVPYLVNVGIIGLKSDEINWAKVEHWIGQLEANQGKSYYLEQALSAMLIGDQKAEILPMKEYMVNPENEVSNHILHHYVDLSKKIYYTNAWKQFL